MPRPSRDEATRMRTRVAAKMSLLSWLSGMYITENHNTFNNLQIKFIVFV